MAVLLVTIDPENEKSATKLDKEINAFLEQFKHVRLSENTYAIRTKDHPRVISWELQKILDQDATYYVAALSSPYDGFGPVDTNDWLKKNLKK